MNRRTHLRYILGGALALTVNPSDIWAKVNKTSSAPKDLGMLLEALTDQILEVPKTSANEINHWANFVYCFANEFVSPADKALFYLGCEKWQAHCQKQYNAVYEQLDPKKQKKVLQHLFDSLHPKDFPEAQQWAKQLRSYVFFAFYTSERGATEQLAYLPIPGKYEGDLPLQPNQKAWTL